MIFQNLPKFHSPNGSWNYVEQFWNITRGIYAKYHYKSCYYLYKSWVDFCPFYRRNEPLPFLQKVVVNHWMAKFTLHLKTFFLLNKWSSYKRMTSLVRMSHANGVALKIIPSTCVLYGWYVCHKSLITHLLCRWPLLSMVKFSPCFL